MATYYVRKTGSDSNAGTSAGAAWLTIGKALGASGISSGDTVYVGAGVYREAVTVGMTSAVAETQVIADVDGAQTGDAGEVRWTAYLTNDTTAPGAASPLVLGGRDFLTFKKFTFQGGTGACVNATTNVSTNCKFEDCTFLPGSGIHQHGIDITTTTQAALDWTITRCRFLGVSTSNTGKGVHVTASTFAGGADYDLNVQVTNCLFVNTGAGVQLSASASNTFRPGGVDVFNCTMVGVGFGVVALGSCSTSIPITTTNTLVITGGTGVWSQSAGMHTEDYSHFYAATPRTNVSAGANSTSDGSKALRVHMGQEHVYGEDVMFPFFAPTASSPLLGAGTNTGAPSVDLLGTARPNPPSIGCYEEYSAPTVGGGGGGGPLIGGRLVH